MTRIGFAYNQKPESSAPASPVEDGDDLSRPDEEPPSSRRDVTSRSSDSPAASEQPGAPVSHHPAPVTPRTAAGTLLSDEYAEWDSPQTIDAVTRALSALGEVIPLEATEDFPARLRASRPDIVFNIAEGLSGMNRESHVPAICEFFGVPYTGSDPFTLSLCLHKARAKEVLAFHGISTPAFALVESEAELDALSRSLSGRTGRTRRPTVGRRLAFPLFVKPVHEGSSKGITERNLCHDRAELEAQVSLLLASYGQPVLVEEFLTGAEFTCAVLGNGDTARVLPLVGLRFDALPDGALPIYGYEAKWLWDRPERPLEIFECPAAIDPLLAREIEALVLRTMRVLACRDWARIDVRLDAGGRPSILEINPLPGVLPDLADNSCFPKAARAAGMSYDELIRSCLLTAAARCGIGVTGAPRTRLAASG